MSFHIYESPENYLLQTNLPGFDESEFEISIKNQILSIKGNRRNPDGTTLVQEIAQKNQRVRLTQDVDIDAIRAVYQKGLLSITLPKRTKRITIKVA